MIRLLCALQFVPQEIISSCNKPLSKSYFPFPHSRSLLLSISLDHKPPPTMAFAFEGCIHRFILPHWKLKSHYKRTVRNLVNHSPRRTFGFPFAGEKHLNPVFGKGRGCLCFETHLENHISHLPAHVCIRGCTHGRKVISFLVSRFCQGQIMANLPFHRLRAVCSFSEWHFRYVRSGWCLHQIARFSLYVFIADANLQPSFITQTQRLHQWRWQKAIISNYAPSCPFSLQSNPNH